jgi:hypothetical protein
MNGKSRITQKCKVSLIEDPALEALTFPLKTKQLNRQGIYGLNAVAHVRVYPKRYLTLPFFANGTCTEVREQMSCLA